MDHSGRVQSFAALADPTRRRIIEMLARAERPAGEIVAAFQMTGAAISQHLKALRLAGLVTVRRDRQRRIHALNPAGLREIELWAAQTRLTWERRLDALETELRRQDEQAQKNTKQTQK